MIFPSIFSSPIWSFCHFCHRTCGYIFLSKSISTTLVMKGHLFGMRLTYRMQFGNPRVPGFFLWSISHQRYFSIDLLVILQIRNRWSEGWVGLTLLVCLTSLKILIDFVTYLHFHWELTVFLSQDLKHNGTLFAHVFFARSGFPLDPSDPEFQPLSVFERTHC